MFQQRAFSRLLLFALPAATAGLIASPADAGAATFVVTVGAAGTNFVDQTSGTNTTTIHVGDTVQ